MLMVSATSFLFLWCKNRIEREGVSGRILLIYSCNLLCFFRGENQYFYAIMIEKYSNMAIILNLINS